MEDVNSAVAVDALAGIIFLVSRHVKKAVKTAQIHTPKRAAKMLFENRLKAPIQLTTGG
jgi:hypothetical protein